MIIQVRVLEQEIRTSAAVLVRIPEQRIPPNKGRPISSVPHFPSSPFQEGLIVLSSFKLFFFVLFSPRDLHDQCDRY